MSITGYLRDVERLEKEINKLHQKSSEEVNKEAKLHKKILETEKSITKNTSPGITRSKLQQIERLRKDLSKIAETKAKIAKDIVAKNKQLTQKREKLQKAEQQQQQQQQQQQRQRERGLQTEVKKLKTETAKLQAELNVVYDAQAILSEVFVLESDEAMLQGTCFNLAGIGLVTCEHVLQPGLLLFHPSNLTRTFPIEVTSSNPTLDIAKIVVPGLQLGKGLPIGSADAIEVMDKILLVGFPNYRKGDTGIIAPGLVTGFRTISGTRRMLVNTPIIAGNSGGPVLDEIGKIIGVAVTGADRMEDAGETEHHGVIPIDILSFI